MGNLSSYPLNMVERFSGRLPCLTIGFTLCGLALSAILHSRLDRPYCIQVNEVDTSLFASVQILLCLCGERIAVSYINKPIRLRPGPE